MITGVLMNGEQLDHSQKGGTIRREIKAENKGPFGGGGKPHASVIFLLSCFFSLLF